MNVFQKYMQPVVGTIAPHLLPLIKVNSKKFPPYVIFTYSVNGKRHQPDDKVYAQNPDLLEILPRSCSIVCRDDQIVGALTGMRKFTGPVLSEDPEDEDTNTLLVDNNERLFDTTKIQAWADAKQLHVLRTTKENGKFAIIRLMRDPVDGTLLIAGGSKNNHIVTDMAHIHDFAVKREGKDGVNEILAGIFADVERMRETLLMDGANAVHKLMADEGYALVGELCDGQHFTEGDNRVHWFGLFRNGSALEPVKALQIIRDAGFHTVDHDVVFTPNTATTATTLDSLFRLSRCLDNEGSVLYCTNTHTGETILYKSKSVMYIVKRFMRQIIMRGYAHLEDIRTRFVAAADYHELNTAASVRITHQLYNFGLWMMNKDYPTKVLNVVPVQAVRGSLPNGFALYWKEYREETGDPEIVVTESDFGRFDEGEYLNQTQLYPRRDELKAPLVVFIQGLQGSGKSTVGALLKERLDACKIVEQDVTWGDTLAAQGKLYHHASDGKTKVIFVTRCNVNPQQYAKYLAIAHERSCRVLFIAAQDLSPLYFAVSFAGIIQRSTVGDQLLVGRNEFPIGEVYNFVSSNYYGMQVHPQACRYATMRSHAAFSEQLKAIGRDKHAFLDFVQANQAELLACRLGLDEIVENILEHVRPALAGGYVDKLVRSAFVLYVTFQMEREQEEKLRDHLQSTEVAKSALSLAELPGIEYQYYCTHITQAHLGKSKRSSVQLIPPFVHVKASIDYIVVRKSDGAAAFHVRNILRADDGSVVGIESQRPHVTGRLPVGIKPVEGIRLMVDQDMDGFVKVPYECELDLTCLHKTR